MVWTAEPTYRKPEISVRATTLYYEIVASIMLPFMEGRLLNLFRCRQEQCFFQRSAAHPPSGNDLREPVKFVPVEQKNGRTEEYLFVTNAAGIIACAKVQTVEFHGWGSRAHSIETPDRMVIDLDPGEGVTFEDVKAAALQVRRSFEAVGLQSFALLTGGKGIHVVVPLSASANWPTVRSFAKTFCTALAEADPVRFTVTLSKESRRGRIFLDFLRNQRTATAVMPYSARARSRSPVAAPVNWDELNQVVSADAFSTSEVEQLLKRATTKVRDWGVAEQLLPRFI